MRERHSKPRLYWSAYIYCVTNKRCRESAKEIFIKLFTLTSVYRYKYRSIFDR